MPSWVIVGASRGLGYEWLRQLSSEPTNQVFGLVRNVAAVKARLADDNLSNVHILKADMVDHNSLNTAAAEVSKITGGSVDFLIVNGAHNSPALAFTSSTEFAGREDELRKDLTSSMEVNVLGAIFSINAFLPQVRKSNIKKIIAISTGFGDPDLAIASGNATFVAYASMKAALNMVVAKYSAELKSDGISLLALSPGVVSTQETPPTAEEIEKFQGMLKQIQARKPDWTGPFTPAESVSHMRKVIDNLTIEQSGAFLSHWGNKEWI